MDTADFAEIKQLEQRLLGARLPAELLDKCRQMVVRLDRIARLGGNYAIEYDNTARYIDWVVSLPWETRTQDTLDIDNAQKILDKNHYGLKGAKEKILEYLAVLKLKTQNSKLKTDNLVIEISRAPILVLVGLAGTGKTSLAYSVASAMGKRMERIPFGGIGDALYLRGQSRAYPDAEPGAVIKALRRCGSKNPVILLDEIDRVAQEAQTTIMGVLVELLDPEQNSKYTDHYLDYPFDLSEVLFVATANNTANISTAVLDRLEPIQMPSYSDEEKIAIGKNYLLPKILAYSGLPENALRVDDILWPRIVRPLGFDAGIRTLERTITGMVRKTARIILANPNQPIAINEANIGQFLPQ